jgi:hypothetical protein
MMIAECTPREELILEVLRAASDRISVQDFDIQCELAPVSLGKSYYDRLRVADSLIQECIIEKVDGCLRIVAKDVPTWLMQGMLSGSSIFWQIFEVLDHHGKLKCKIDLALLTTIGLDGEEEVIRQLNQCLPSSARARIKHISLTDDSAGFDIFSPSTLQNDSVCLLEVKTSSRPSADFSFFISKNEARVASQNENWRLVAVRREPRGYMVLGHLRFSHFSEILPQDTSTFSKWETASVAVPVDLIVPGLP